MATSVEGLPTRPRPGPPPPFEPFPGLGGGHVQTVLGAFLPSGSSTAPSSRDVAIPLDDGDRITARDAVPDRWANGRPMALLVHGLCGSAESSYMVRLARRLDGLGCRTVRMDLRGAGESLSSCRRTYHSGRSDDVRAVAAWMADQAPDSPIALVGFSLGGNLVLKLAAESAGTPVSGLDCVLAACPPIDLAVASRHLKPVYQGHFARLLVDLARRHHRLFPEQPHVDLSRVRTVVQFDEAHTAPRNGFADAADYYARCSSGPLLGRITVPGLIIAAEDDPFIPPGPFREFPRPSELELEITARGGHLGFLSRSSWWGDRRWLDARLTAWLVKHWANHWP